MLILHILRSFLIGVLFTFLSINISHTIILSMKQVYHTIGFMLKKPEIFYLIVLNIIFSTTWIGLAWGRQFIWLDLSIIFLFSLIAAVDQLTDRIPILFLLLGAILGVTIGCLRDQLNFTILGGLSNSILSILIYFTGQIYQKRVLRWQYASHVFGFGDVYACGSLGFIFGSPLGNVAFFLTLLLAIFGAGIQSKIQGTTFLKHRVKLGLYFYLATLLITMAKML